jgi:two-component system phosphate regulon sensor histidine kinase PhoR
MQERSKISGTIVKLTLISTLICTAVFLALFKLGNFRVDLAYFFLSVFVFFVCIFITLYYFYFTDVASGVDKLSEKIRSRFLTKEIPQKHNQLEELDSMSELGRRVDQLIESRESELAQIKNMDSYRKEYLGNVSHELKTPIFNVQGYIDTLLNGGLEDPSINMDYLKRAERSVDRIINIIDDLETITQLETGDLHLDNDKFDIASLCKELYGSLELVAGKKNITLELAKKYDKPVFVMADRYRIRQVLVNLITNSIKYGKENGTTTVGFSYLNNDVIITVADNGPGIEKEHLSRIFERFYRVDKGRSREQGGTGLGLAIVKHIMDVHQKSIKVESNIGLGTVFTFSLAAAD